MARRYGEGMAEQKAEPKDKRVRVPLDPGDLKKVEERAKENLRSIGRETAMLVKDGLRLRQEGEKT